MSYYQISGKGKNIENKEKVSFNILFDKDKVQYTYNSPEAVKAGKLLSELSSKGCMKTFTEKYANQTEYGAGNAMFSISSIGSPSASSVSPKNINI